MSEGRWKSASRFWRPPVVSGYRVVQFRLRSKTHSHAHVHTHANGSILLLEVSCFLNLFFARTHSSTRESIHANPSDPGINGASTSAFSWAISAILRFSSGRRFRELMSRKNCGLVIASPLRVRHGEKMKHVARKDRSTKASLADSLPTTCANGKRWSYATHFENLRKYFQQSSKICPISAS